MLERQMALSGPRAWRRRFGKPPYVVRRSGPGSRHAGQEGHRWGWLIKLIGWPNFQKLSALGPETRKEYIEGIKEYALTEMQAMLEAGTAGEPTEDVGTLMMATSYV